jgi:hypothetical protein
MPKIISPGEALRRIETPPDQHPHQTPWAALQQERRDGFERRAANFIAMAQRIEVTRLIEP